MCCASLTSTQTAVQRASRKGDFMRLPGSKTAGSVRSKQWKYWKQIKEYWSSQWKKDCWKDLSRFCHFVLVYSCLVKEPWHSYFLVIVCAVSSSLWPYVLPSTWVLCVECGVQFRALRSSLVLVLCRGSDIHAACVCPLLFTGLVVRVCGFEFAWAVRSSVCVCCVLCSMRFVFTSAISCCHVLCGRAVGESSHWLRVHVMFCLRIWLAIVFTGHVLLLLSCLVWAQGLSCLFLCAMCSPVYCLNPALLVIWLLVRLSHLSFIVYLLTSSLIYPSCVFSPVTVCCHYLPFVSCPAWCCLPCPALSSCQSCFPSRGSFIYFYFFILSFYFYYK